MRVLSISEVNTQQQQNPFLLQTAGSNGTGKTASTVSFEEYFKSFFQQKNAPVAVKQPETHASGMYWGFYPSLKVSPKSEQKLDANAY